MRRRGVTDRWNLEYSVNHGTANRPALLLYRILDLSRSFLWLRKHIVTTRYQADLYRTQRLNQNDPQMKIPPDSRTILRQMAELAYKEGFGMLLIPEVTSIGEYAFEPYFLMMKEVCRTGKARCLDPLPALDSITKPGLFIDSTHLTESGHRVLAELIAPEIREALGLEQ